MPASVFSGWGIKKHQGYTGQSFRMGMEDGGKGTQDLGRLLVFEWMVGLIYLCSRTSHSSDEEAEGQRGKTTALKSHRTKIRGQFSWVSGQLSSTVDMPFSPH